MFQWFKNQSGGGELAYSWIVEPLEQLKETLKTQVEQDVKYVQDVLLQNDLGTWRRVLPIAY